MVIRYRSGGEKGMGNGVLKNQSKKNEQGLTSLKSLEQQTNETLIQQSLKQEENETLNPIQEKVTAAEDTIIPEEDIKLNTNTEQTTDQVPEEQSSEQITEKSIEEQTPEEKSSGEGDIIDKVKASMLNMMKKVTNIKNSKSDEQDNSGGEQYFDSLPVKWKEKDAPSIENPPEIEELKKRIGTLREGNLYQAVIVSRLLKDNQSNPMASGAISRAINSSAWNTITDLNASVTGATGLLSTFDKNAKSQTVYQGAALVTNLITTVTSMRNFYLKFKKIKFQNTLDTWIDNTFLIIGMVGDFATIFAKSVAIAKTLASWGGKNLPMLNKISNWMFLATGTSQAIALMNTSRGLLKGWKGISGLQKREAGIWNFARDIINGVNGGIYTQEEMEAWDEDTRLDKAKSALDMLNNTSDENTEKSNVEKNPKNEKKDNHEQEKDVLVQYLGLSKRIKKMKHDEVSLAATAINCIVGIGSSIITGGRFVTAQGTARTRKDSWNTANQVMGYAAKGAGLVANGTAILSSGVRIGSRLTNREDDRSNAVEERLFEKIDTLGQEEHGLKYLEESLINLYAQDSLKEAEKNLLSDNTENSENSGKEAEKNKMQKDAAETVKMYESTEKMITMMGVPMEQLIQAKKLEEFKKILVAGLV